jgi:hypothetical protein
MSWFGSLVVLFAIVSEYSLLQHQLKNLYEGLKGQGVSADGNAGIPDLTPNDIHIYLVRISHMLIIIGTLIWGFGKSFLSYALSNN